MFRYILLLIMICFSGCATFSPSPESIKGLSDSEIHKEIKWRISNGMDTALFKSEIISRHPEWPEDIKETIKKSSIKIGMTKEQILASWGKPDDVNRTVTSRIVHEQWVYSEYPFNSYLYFEKGELVSWQD